LTVEVEAVVVDVAAVWQEEPRSLSNLIVTRGSLWHVARRMLFVPRI
jgi:hypothetical protein